MNHEIELDICVCDFMMCYNRKDNVNILEKRKDFFSKTKLTCITNSINYLQFVTGQATE